MVAPFLDTNVVLRHLRQDHPILSPRATAIFARIGSGQLDVRTSDTVVFETVFTLQKTYAESRERIASALLAIIELPGITLPGKEQYRDVFDLFVTGSPGFADCYHIVLMRHRGISEILSFDTEFDRISGIERRES
jgi:predicted nucleic acid-binding protein